MTTTLRPLVLGVDPGRKNLALCLIRPGADPLGRDDVIVQWAVLDLDPSPRGVVRCMAAVRGWPADWTDVCVAIERQPPKNPAMKRLEHHLEMHFATLGADVRAIDPKHKLAFAARTPWWPPGDITSWTYAKRKKLAVQTVSAMLRDDVATGVAPGVAPGVAAAFWETKKKDDFADSLLHAMAYAHVVQQSRRRDTGDDDAPTRVRKIRPVPPGDEHVRTGRYSQGGLKFLSKGHTAGGAEAFATSTACISGFAQSCARHFGGVAEAYAQLA